MLYEVITTLKQSSAERSRQLKEIGDEIVITSYSIHYTKLYDLISNFWVFLLKWESIPMMESLSKLEINKEPPESRAVSSLIWLWILNLFSINLSLICLIWPRIKSEQSLSYNFV